MWHPILGGLLVIVILPGHARKTIIPKYDCDHDQLTFSREGNQGPVGMFPWLGVIRVTLSEGAKLRIAVTGAVLIRITFAIAHAEDIAKIPNQILREHTKAMFISTDDSPWLYAIRRYDAAPDFRTNTMSSIALVELELKDDPTPLMPICWQDRNYHFSHKHYAMGFTDERYLLEKIAYDMMFINKKQCEIYYQNLNMHANQKYVPAQYQCWAAMNNTRNCMWENGMILVSNYTGTWFLIGIGIRGPGCSLPVRFIPVLPYVQWIEHVINEAFLRMKSDKVLPRFKELPAHALYANEPEPANEEVREIDGIPYRRVFNPPQRASKSSNQEDDGTRPFYDAYRRMYAPVNLTTDPPVLAPTPMNTFAYAEEDWKRDDIRNMDPNVLQLRKFWDKYERSDGDCTRAGHLVYKEISEVVKTPNVIGSAFYRLSLIDLEIYRFTCIVIRIISRSRSDCNLWYSIAKTVDEPLAMLDDTPGELLKHYIPVGERSTTGPFEENALFWEPHENLEPFFLKEGRPLVPKWWMNLTSLNLYLKFDFIEDAQLVLEVWGPSSESLYGVLKLTPPRANISRTLTRLMDKGNLTRSTSRRTRRTRKRTKRTRKRRPPRRTTTPKPTPGSPPPPFDEAIFHKNRAKKATITEMGNLTARSGNLTANSGSNGSDYVESGLCLIVILFISTFG